MSRKDGQPAGGKPEEPSAVKIQKRPPALAAAASGALSGAVISASVQPLDVLRTRMQADAALGTARSTAQTFRVILQEGGVRGFWRGTGPTVVRLSVGAGINFVVLERLKHFMLQSMPHVSGQLGFFQAALVGGLSRALSAAVMSPVTLVKTRMEYGGPQRIMYKNTWDALSTIARTEGPRGLFRGMGPTVLTNAPFSALYYMFYTKLKGWLGERVAASTRPDQQQQQQGVPQAAVNFVSGVCAATAATLLTQPTDVVRTRMQLGIAAGGNSWATFTQALKSAGPQALLIGAGPRVMKRTMQTALVWTLYEELLPRLTALHALCIGSAEESVPPAL